MTLPSGFAVRLSATTRVRDRGRTLIGGAPLRLNYLTPRACELLQNEPLVVDSRETNQLADHLLASGMVDPVPEQIAPVPLDQVTCVIPIRDRAESLDRLLTHIGQSISAIVVDDASLDAESVAETATRHGAKLIALHRNIGPAGARNVGLAAATTPYVAFIDSDVVIDPEAIGILLRHMNDPRVALVAPRIRALDDGQSWIGRYEAARSSLDLGPDSALVRPNSRVAWVPSAAVVARVDALGAGFDASMRVGEDVDLVWRLEDEGWRVRYDASVVARHEHRVTAMSWLRRKAFYGTGATPLAERHGPKIAPAMLTPIGTATAVVVLGQRRWSLPLVAMLAGVMSWRLSRATRKGDNPIRTAAELTALGVSANLAQLMHLLLRHWWPVAALGAIVSSRMRRALIVAATVDTLIERERLRPEMTPFAFAAALRLDDLAYGAGLWAGAIRGRTMAALLPRIRASANADSFCFVRAWRPGGLDASKYVFHRIPAGIVARLR